MDRHFRVDVSQVARVADVLQRLPLKSWDELAAARVPRSAAAREALLRAFLFASAICHQTHGLAGVVGDSHYKGWDFLLRRFCSTAATEPGRLSPITMLDASGETLEHLLAGSEGNEINLPDLSRRAEILRDLSGFILRRWQGALEALVESTGGRAAGPAGLYARLAEAPAFGDPLMKKTSAFISCLYWSHTLEIQDAEAIVPMIDYHKQRLLLRLGCVSVRDAGLASRLREHAEISEEHANELRQRCVETFRALSEMARMPVFEVDALLWAHARSCCHRDPVCMGSGPELDTFYSYLSVPFDGRCAFQDVCIGASNASVRALWQPEVRTEDY